MRFALDWTPNTNHTGLFVAQQQGWFTDAGLDVQILPYNSTSPDTLVVVRRRRLRHLASRTRSRSRRPAGADIVSVLARLQHWGTGIGVRADRADIALARATSTARPTAASAPPTRCRRCRRSSATAGGKGDFKTVVLGTSAYEALYAGQADFTEPFLAWEGIEASCGTSR